MQVTLRITGIASTADASRKPLAFSQIEGSDIVIRSPLGSQASLNDHLVWLWGMLKNERRFLKSLASQGAALTVMASGVSGSIRIEPNGAELLHLLGVALVVERDGL